MMVSVIIPVYNSERYIKNTLDSILSQTFENFEVILINDKSTDKSVEIINSYIEKDKRFKLINLERNSGAAVARNAGIIAAKGKYIAFIDSDDKWISTKLEEQVKFMEDNDYPFTYTHYNKLDMDGNVLEAVKPKSKVTYSDMLKTNYIGCSTVILNREKLGTVTMPLLRKRQDYATWLKILKLTDYGIGYEKVLTNYTVRSDSISSNKFKLIKYNYRVFRDVEGFGVIKSTFYLCVNILYKIIK